MEYKLYFKHNRKSIPEHTECTIKKDGVLVVATGFAVLCKTDQFDKRIGRKISLARALKTGGFNKKTKTQIWEQYKKTHKL